MSMSAAKVTSMMRQLTLHPEAAERARDMDRGELQDRFGLTDAEISAIVDRRLDVLYEMGVHEVTLMQYSRTFGFSIAERWAELTTGAAEA